MTIPLIRGFEKQMEYSDPKLDGTGRQAKNRWALQIGVMPTQILTATFQGYRIKF